MLHTNAQVFLPSVQGEEKACNLFNQDNAFTSFPILFLVVSIT